MVAQRRRTAERSRSGGGGGPRRRGAALRRGWVAREPESREREESLREVVVGSSGLLGSSDFFLRDFFSFPVRGSSEDVDGEFPSRFMDGRTSFFCFDAGRISSRSTGTPRETRKRRRIRDLIQFGGWRGGGATSCDHRERERSFVKMAESSFIVSTRGREGISFVLGKMVSSWLAVAEMRFGSVLRESKSRSGGYIFRSCKISL